MITPGGMTDKNVSTDVESNQSTSSILLLVNTGSTVAASDIQYELNDKSDTIDKIAFIFIPLQFIRHRQENHILWVSSMLLLYSITTKPRLTEVYHDLKGCEGRQR